MNITPEQALKRIARRAKDLRDVAANYARIEQFDRAQDRDIEAAAIDWALARIAELEARDATDCPHIRPYMAAVDDVESFDFWLSRASDAELRCAVALQRHEIDRLRTEPMRAAADTLRAMAEQHRIKNTCNGHWCASNAGEANRLLWVALLETADAMESKHESA